MHADQGAQALILDKGCELDGIISKLYLIV